MKRITFISDTHNKHNQITADLPGGDILIHAGDISSMGYDHEIQSFCKWFNSIDSYTTKIFIAGNHDFGFEDNIEYSLETVNSFKWIDYLQDDLLMVGDSLDKLIKIWGAPWQPEFHHWAFNVKRGEAIAEKWSLIPKDTDILITHGPAWGYLDRVIGKVEHLGCEELAKRIGEIKPKIHVCGHIHSGHGYYYNGDTHFINASVLNESYNYAYKPITVDWEPTTNDMTFL